MSVPNKTRHNLVWLWCSISCFTIYTVIFNFRVFVIKVSFYLKVILNEMGVFNVKHDVAMCRKENVVTFLGPVIERVPLVNFFHQSVKLIFLRELQKFAP